MQPRRLVLVRHAQAAGAPVDADRALTELGRRRAGAIGQWLDQAALLPDRVVVSPALRAVQTWEMAAAALQPRVPPEVDGRIYDNTVDRLLAIVRETPEEIASLVLVGHNPSMGELAAVLADGQGGVPGGGFPAGAVAVFDVAAPFPALAPGAATLSAFAVPGG